MNKKSLLMFLFCVLLFSVHSAVMGFQNMDEYPRFEDGMAMPMLNYSDPTVPNEESEIQRFVVYVETEHDTDGDGLADLVKVFLQVPRAALDGKLQGGGAL